MAGFAFNRQYSATSRLRQSPGGAASLVRTSSKTPVRGALCLVDNPCRGDNGHWPNGGEVNDRTSRETLKSRMNQQQKARRDATAAHAANGGARRRRTRVLHDGERPDRSEKTRCEGVAQ